MGARGVAVTLLTRVDMAWESLQSRLDRFFSHALFTGFTSQALSELTSGLIASLLALRVAGAEAFALIRTEPLASGSAPIIFVDARGDELGRWGGLDVDLSEVHHERLQRWLIAEDPGRYLSDLSRVRDHLYPGHLYGDETHLTRSLLSFFLAKHLTPRQVRDLARFVQSQSESDCSGCESFLALSQAHFRSDRQVRLRGINAPHVVNTHFDETMQNEIETFARDLAADEGNVYLALGLVARSDGALRALVSNGHGASPGEGKKLAARLDSLRYPAPLSLMAPFALARALERGYTRQTMLAAPPEHGESQDPFPQVFSLEDTLRDPRQDVIARLIASVGTSALSELGLQAAQAVDPYGLTDGVPLLQIYPLALTRALLALVNQGLANPVTPLVRTHGDGESVRLFTPSTSEPFLDLWGTRVYHHLARGAQAYHLWLLALRDDHALVFVVTAHEQKLLTNFPHLDATVSKFTLLVDNLLLDGSK